MISQADLARSMSEDETGGVVRAISQETGETADQQGG
jgi:hypothetical protein